MAKEDFFDSSLLDEFEARRGDSHGFPPAWRNSRSLLFAAALLGAVAICVAVFHFAPAHPQSPIKTGAKQIAWQPYSDERLKQAAQDGKPVMIDFSATW